MDICSSVGLRSIATPWAGLFTHPQLWSFFIPGAGRCHLPTGYLYPLCTAVGRDSWQQRLSPILLETPGGVSGPWLAARHPPSHALLPLPCCCQG